MPGYHERLRELDGTRWLLRDFLVYGCRTRSEFEGASTRTYDNERRRVEALLGDALVWQYDRNGKHFFVSADASVIAANPLHRMYRLHNFTDNDIVLHFFLMDALADDAAHSLPELTENVCGTSGIIFEEITVRRKLSALQKLGLITVQKQGKRMLYTAAHPSFEEVFPDDTNIPEMLSFFREAVPFGSFADELMMKERMGNDFFRFKHHFLMYTLDDAECLHILEAMHAQKAVSFILDAQHGDHPPRSIRLIPLVIRISEQTGRRYLIGWDLEERHARSCRMDLIHHAAAEDTPENADELRRKAADLLDLSWGVSLPNKEAPEHFALTLRIDPEKEGFILERLKREARGGTVVQDGLNLFRYENTVLDTQEALPWIRSFTGRIVSFTGDNENIVSRFWNDMQRMQELYGGTENGSV